MTKLTFFHVTNNTIFGQCYHVNDSTVPSELKDLADKEKGIENTLSIDGNTYKTSWLDRFVTKRIMKLDYTGNFANDHWLKKYGVNPPTHSVKKWSIESDKIKNDLLEYVKSETKVKQAYDNEGNHCGRCGGTFDCYSDGGLCDDCAESGLSDKEWHRRDTKEWFRESRAEEFGMGFREG